MMLKGIPLKEYVDQFGQMFVAKQVGVSQATICLMLKNGREVFIEAQDNGAVRAFEIKRLGHSAKIKAA